MLFCADILSLYSTSYKQQKDLDLATRLSLLIAESDPSKDLLGLFRSYFDI